MPDRSADEIRPPLWLRRPRLIERGALTVIGVAVVTGVVAETVTNPSVGGIVGPVLAAGGAALGLRAPLPGIVVLAIAPAAAAVLGHDPLLTWTITVFAAFLLTFRGVSARWTGLLVGVSNFFSVTLAESGVGGWLNPIALVAVSLTLVATVTGSATRTQLRYFQSIKQRAQDAIAARDTEATRRVAEERMRIARDLHDVIGHEVAVLGMHLGVAEVSVPATDERTRASLASARLGVQSILRETQRILEVLRPTAEGENRQPAPEAADIRALVESFRGAGMSIDADLPPALSGVGATVGVTAYRVAQEALTNAHRHGNGTAAVSLRLTPTSLRLTIANPTQGGGGESRGSGFGLIGMRERAQSAGGRVEAGQHGTEFRVEAVLPLNEGGRA
ncbi:MAG TPA: histidine kinase [Naasia sp.]